MRVMEGPGALEPGEPDAMYMKLDVDYQYGTYSMTMYMDSDCPSDGFRITAFKNADFRDMGSCIEAMMGEGNMR